ncbi:MAG: hypothetical protein Q8Q35_03865 [Nanoarchaeota archaeon]|nr:hypothetical protein [Nanoarchaeota archaeon]
MDEATMKGNKGIFYSLSLTFLALSLLTLSIIFVTHSESVESRQIELSFSHKIYDLESSVQKVFSDALINKGITFDSNNYYYTFGETIPRDLTNLENEFSDLKSNIESDFNIINITLSNFESNPRITSSQGIIYSLENNQIIYIEENDDITGYNITLVFTQNMTSCNPSLDESGTFNLRLSVQSIGENCLVTSSSLDDGEINLNFGSDTVSIDIDDDGDLIITTPNVTVQSTILAYFNTPSVYPSLSIPISLLIHDPSLNFTKTSNVLLY